MIRWVDMVDLRGKPPYLPESKTYTDVLKAAIEDSFKYYGFDPETYLETMPEVTGLIGDRQKAFPALKRNAVPLRQTPTTPVSTSASQVVPTPGAVTQIMCQGVTTQITPQVSSATNGTTIPAISISANSFMMQPDEDDEDDIANDVSNDEINNDVGGGDEDDDDEDEDGENLPPKLPMPIGKMNCSLTRLE